MLQKSSNITNKCEKYIVRTKNSDFLQNSLSTNGCHGNTKKWKFLKVRKRVANNILGKLTKFAASSVSRSGVIGHQSWHRPQKPPTPRIGLTATYS